MKKIMSILLVFAMILSSAPVSVFAQDDTTSSKTSVMSEDEQTVTTTIEFTGPKSTPNVLFFLGTACPTHGLEASTIDNAMNSLLEKANVDLLQATDGCATYDGSYYAVGNQVTSFVKQTSWQKGDHFTNENNQSYVIETGGYHTLSKTGAKELAAALSSKEYDFIVIAYDGFISGLFYHESTTNEDVEGSYTAYGEYKVAKNWIDADNITAEDRKNLYAVAKLLEEMPIVLLTAKRPVDSYSYADNAAYDLTRGYDCGNVSYDYSTKYFNSKYKGSTVVLNEESKNGGIIKETEGKEYIYARAVTDVLAFIKPDLWLTLVDEDGQYKVNEAPSFSSIGFDKMDITDYANSEAVAKNVESLLNGVLVEFEDTMADGLTPKTMKMEKYNPSTSSWTVMSENEYVQSIDGQKVNVKVNYTDGKYYDGESYRLTITSKVEESFQPDGTLADSNNGDAVVSIKNPNGEPFIRVKLESPQVKKTVYTVTFDGNKNGTIDGLEVEHIWKYSTEKKNITANSATPNDNFLFKGFTCKQAVELEDGTKYAVGDLIPAAVLTTVIVDKDLDFVAQYDELIDITVTKIWDDNDNQDGYRPEAIEIILKGGEEDIKATLDSSNRWEYTFEDLMKFNDGKEIEYTVEEVEVEGYESKVEGTKDTKFIITNTHEIEKVAVTITKEWDDGNDIDKIRPESINCVLYSNGEELEVVALSAENQWTFTIEDLDKFADGNLIEYTVEEVDEVEGYELTDITCEDYKFTITNSHTPVTDPNPGKTPATGDYMLYALSTMVSSAVALAATVIIKKKNEE